MPKVQGGGASQPQITPDLVRVLDARAAARPRRPATNTWRRTGCWWRSPRATGRPARALRSAGATPQALEKAVTDIRKGRKVDQPERRSDVRRAEEIRA